MQLTHKYNLENFKFHNILNNENRISFHDKYKIELRNKKI